MTTFIAGIVDQVLAGQDISPETAPWTVLVPGAEGEVVVAVQEALIAAGVEVTGGADGIYGDDTMLAVAESSGATTPSRRRAPSTWPPPGSLGVYRDPRGRRCGDGGGGGAVDCGRGDHDRAAPAGRRPGHRRLDRRGDDGGSPRWALVVATALVVAVAGVVVRRRYVLAQRAERRWARVHPSTSPRRSVADLRRAGQLPPGAGRGGHRRTTTSRTSPSCRPAPR